MKPTLELLKMYQEEKTMVIGPLKSRTGLETFPSFADWLSEYIQDHSQFHVTVSVAEADAIFQNVIDEADGLINKSLEIKCTPDAVELAHVSKPMAISPVKKRAVGKTTKTSQAQALFAQHYGILSRAAIIELFVTEVQLTKAGASTYYQKFKSTLVE